MTKVDLSKKKAGWLGKRTTTLKGNPLYYDISSQNAYNKQVRTLYKELEDETQKKIKDIFREHKGDSARIKRESNKLIKKLDKKYTTIFENQSKKLAKTMASNQLKNSQSKLKVSLAKLTGNNKIKTDIMPPRLEQIVSRSIKDNVSAISGIPNKYLGSLKKSIKEVAEGKSTLGDLDKKFSKRSSQSKRYIKNMTAGESKRLYNNINSQRLATLGVKCFEWIETYQAVTPRHQHIQLSGKIFYFNDLPIIDEEGTRGLPGDAYNCHCIMIPRIEYKNGELQ